MPVINTRKRKPDEVSALDRLATVSAHELSSRNHSSPLPVVYPEGPRFSWSEERVQYNQGDSEEGDGESTQKRRRVREEYSTEETSYGGDWCSRRVHEEILRLQVTVESILGRGRLEMGSAPTPLQTLQSIHGAVRSLQSFVTQSADTNRLALHTRPALDLLWQQGRESVKEDVRSQLSFWKHKAQDVKERLRVSLEATKAPPAPADPSATPSTPRDPALQNALDFVSTFYLLEMVPDTRQLSGDAFKDKCIATSSETIAGELVKLESQRLRELPIQQPPPMATQTQPAPATMEMALHQANSLSTGRQPEPSPLSTMSSTGNIFENDDEGDDPSDEDEPLPMQSPTQMSVSSSSSTAPFAFGQAPTPTIPPVASQASSSGNGQKGLPLTARRRLALLLESQQAKALAQQHPPVPPHPSYGGPTQHPTLTMTSVPSTTPAMVDSSSTSTATAPNHTKKISLREYTAANKGKTVPGNKSVVSQARTPAKTHSSGLPGSDPNLVIVLKKAKTDRSKPLSNRPTATQATTGGSSESETDNLSTSAGCTSCGRNDSFSSLLLCDNECGREFHTFCLQPPLAKIPVGDWYCPKCREAEQIQPGQRIYLCTVNQCDKITGAKYCSLHRCQAEKCPNRMHSGGRCRRHDINRLGKQSTESTVTDTTTTKISTEESASSRVKDGGAVKANGTEGTSSHGATGTPTPAQLDAATARLNTEQLMSNMRQMGIWLPTHLLGNTKSSKRSKGATSEPGAKSAKAAVVLTGSSSKKQQSQSQPRAQAKR